MATREQQILLEQYNGNGDGGGDSEGSNNNQDHNQVLSAAINGNDDLLTIDTHTCITGVTVCGKCRRDYYSATGSPANRDVDYLKTFPIGYRFEPLDAELILHYLIKKNNNLELPPNNIVNENIYKFHPEDLIEMYRNRGENIWYFFSPRHRKYAKGIRPNRVVDSNRPGYWKATGKEESIEFPKGTYIGYKVSLVFYEGDVNTGVKTNWMTKEYRALNKEEEDRKMGIKMIDLGLYKIYLKPESKTKIDNRRGTANQLGDGSDGLSADNGSRGAGKVVAATSSPVQNNEITRASRPKATVANSGTTMSTFDHDSTMFRDTPFPPPSNVNGSIHHPQQQMAAPQPHPNDYCDSNHLQCRQIQPPPSRFYVADHHQQHVEMVLSQQLVQRPQHRVYSNSWSSNNFSLHDPTSISTNFHQVHCPPPPPYIRLSTPYNTHHALANYDHNPSTFSAGHDHLVHCPPPAQYPSTPALGCYHNQSTFSIDHDHRVHYPLNHPAPRPYNDDENHTSSLGFMNYLLWMLGVGHDR
ncbi:hypothetical protein Syun_030343 [Stephania yunnanensis]|uniref:NAC domain-containing protein n=1 Tax=Stephania yunnanensis TaxID=152371 RepID=A0AAP0E7C7_9MAGN